MSAPTTSGAYSRLELGRLERADPREMWKHEAYEFTPWLRANADRLADALGIQLEITDSEHAVGAFALDLIGRDLTNDCLLIVENQLASSDHSHLGQLLTYTAGTGAATVIWIATRIRDEHRQALGWLNEQTGEHIHFFGVELELVHIGESLPAPLFNVVVLPNDWQKAVRTATSSTAAAGVKGALYAEFWEKLGDRLRSERPAWSRVRQSGQNWYPMSAPLAGCLIAAIFAGGTLRHELRIARRTAEESKAIFDQIAERRDEFEQIYGRSLTWERGGQSKVSHIADYTNADVADGAQHDSYIDWIIDAGDRLRRALDRTMVGPQA
jgi:hypothetical protein